MTDKRAQLRGLAAKFQQVDAPPPANDDEIEGAYEQRLKAIEEASPPAPVIVEPPVAQPVTPRPPRPAKPKAARPTVSASSSSSAMRRTSMTLPRSSVEYLRERSHRTGETQLEIVMRAFLEHREELEATAVTDLADFGMSTRSRSAGHEMSVVVAFYGPRQAFQALDDDAQLLGMSRSQLVSRVLTLQAAADT